jgi:hypothetical protein
MREFGAMVLMLVEAISGDLCKLLAKLKIFVSSRNRELSYQGK